jgi:uncharacterized protein YkwD
VHHAPTRPTRRARHLALTAVATLVATFALSACLSQGQTQDMSLINKERSANRLATVTAHQAAMSKAQAWSERMARTGVLEHTGGGSKVDPKPLTGWCSYGENVGYGSSVQAVHDAFMRSAAHKANMLGKFNVVGTGVVTKGTKVWVTEIYLKTC